MSLRALKESSRAAPVSFSAPQGRSRARTGRFRAPLKVPCRPVDTLECRRPVAAAPVQDATADRDACDDALDAHARDVRHALAGRGRDAVNQAPYTRVFPEGVAHYTDASLDEEVLRYTQLAGRLDAHLAPDDPLRKDELPALRQDLALYQEAATAHNAARLAEEEAGARVAEAAAAWRSQFERAYGGLIERLGKAEAERFFPAVAKPRAKKGAAAPQPAQPARPSAPPVQ